MPKRNPKKTPKSKMATLLHPWWTEKLKAIESGGEILLCLGRQHGKTWLYKLFMERKDAKEKSKQNSEE